MPVGPGNKYFPLGFWMLMGIYLEVNKQGGMDWEIGIDKYTLLCIKYTLLHIKHRLLRIKYTRLHIKHTLLHRKHTTTYKTHTTTYKIHTATYNTLLHIKHYYI